jgi:hypothetical protein
MGNVGAWTPARNGSHAWMSSIPDAPLEGLEGSVETPRTDWPAMNRPAGTWATATNYYLTLAAEAVRVAADGTPSSQVIMSTLTRTTSVV